MSHTISVTKTCLCNFQQKRQSERRYDFARVEDFHYVKNAKCGRTMAREINEFDVIGTCYACYCVCDDQDPKLSERVFSTFIAESDYSNN